jgi:hypothetical protein
MHGCFLFVVLALDCFVFVQPARLPRDVSEKAEAFLRWVLSPASCGLLISVANRARLAAPDRRKASFFQTHHAADMHVGALFLLFTQNLKQIWPIAVIESEQRAIKMILSLIIQAKQ